jgi:hypothetical protein
MKKCKLFLNVCAALFVVLLASCSSEEDHNKLDSSFEGGSVRIKITRSESPATKGGIDPSASISDGDLELNIGDGSGHLFFVDGNNDITKYVEILASGGDGNNDVGWTSIYADGQVIHDVPSASANVYIFLNLPGTLTIPTVGSSISGLEPLITAEQLYDDGAISEKSGGVASVPISGSGELLPVTGKDYDKEASFGLTAIASRIEIKEITTVAGGGNSYIESFDLTGIYINNYYPAAPLGDGGEYPEIKNAGTNPDNYDEVGTAFFNTSNLGSYLFSTDFSNGLGESDDDPTFHVNAGDGVVWGYNVFPNDATGINGKINLPHIILRLDHVKVYSLNTEAYTVDDETRFITVKGYIEEGESLQNLKRGYIYQLGTSVENAFVITPEDLQPEPETYTIDVNVKATLIPWVKVEVTPEI